MNEIKHVQVHVMKAPVIELVLLSGERRVRYRISGTVGEGGDQVRCPNDFIRVHKAVRLGIGVGQKLDAVKALALESALEAAIKAEAANPEEAQRDGCCVNAVLILNDIAMKNTNDACVGKWMIIGNVFWRKHHNVSMGTRVYGVLSSATVVGGVVDAHNLVAINTVIDN